MANAQSCQSLTGIGVSMPPKSDPQRDNVYWLEAEINGAWQVDSASRGSLLFVLGKLSRYYRVSVPTLRIGNKKGRNADAGNYDSHTETIWLNRGEGGANVHVLIHEFAHHVIECYYEDVEDHGKEFVGVYMHLLDKYSILPSQCFRLLAKKYKLKIGRKYRPKAFR